MIEFNDIDLYRKAMIGKKVVAVDPADADEGLVLVFEDGTKLDFRFSGCEGCIEIKEQS